MKRAFLIILILQAVFFSGKAQNPELDSLQNLLQISTEQDTTRVNLLNETAKKLRGIDPDKTLQYAQESQKIAEKLSFKKGKAESLWLIGFYHYVKSDYLQALEYFQKALQLREELGDKKGVADCSYYIGNIYQYQGDYSKALEYYQKSLQLRVVLGDKKGVSSSYGNIGNTYQGQGNFPRALEYYQKALQLFEELDNKRGIAGCLTNIGLIYGIQSNYSKALSYHQQSLQLAKQLENKKGITLNLTNIGILYREQGDYSKALECFQKSLHLNEELGNKRGITFDLSNLGTIYNAQGNPTQAVEYYQKALRLEEELGDKRGICVSYTRLGAVYLETKKYDKALTYSLEALEIAQELGLLTELINKQLSEIYAATNNYQKAYEYHLEYKQVSDSLFNKEQTKKLTSLELNYKFEQERDSIQIANQNRQALLEKDIENRRITQLATYGGLALSFALIGVLAFFFSAQKRNNAKLNAANEEVKMTNEELNTANEEIQTVNETLKVTLDTVEGQRDKIMSSINYAQRIQQAILPSSAMVNKLIPSNFILFKPRDMVSGDFYYVQGKHSKTILAAIDCTGHGVPGAFMSMVGNDLLNAIIKDKQITQADKMLTELHEGVRSALQQEETQNQDGMDMALVVMDEEKKTLEFAGAKNPIVYIQNNELKVIKGDKTPIGGGQKEAARTFTTHQIDISQPTTFYLFSDGYQDQFGGPEGRKFMIKRFRNLLLEIHQKPMEEQKEILDQTIQYWMREGNEEQVDDILVVGVRV